MQEEYEQILRLLDFNNRGYEIFRRWFIDGKGYYHIIIDKKNPKKGIVELRPIDALKIKKMVEVEKETDEKTGTKYVKRCKGILHLQRKTNRPNWSYNFPRINLLLPLRSF